MIDYMKYIICILLGVSIGLFSGAYFWSKHSVYVNNEDLVTVQAADFCGNVDCLRMFKQYIKDRNL